MFNSEDIDQCRESVNRRIGHIPAGTHLIAGLDPASTGFQACVLWAANPETGQLYLVDIKTKKVAVLYKLKNLYRDGMKNII